MMIAWINFIVLTVSALLMLYFYVKSVSPAALEKKIGEVTLWWVIAFILNSPFLAIFSVIWIPIFYIFCWAEERDLTIRYGEAYLEYKRNTGFLIPKPKSNAC